MGINNTNMLIVFWYYDYDDDIPNKDQNVYLNFKIPFLWVTIVHLFGKIRDRLKTVGEFYRNVNILRSQFHKFA